MIKRIGLLLVAALMAAMMMAATAAPAFAGNSIQQQCPGEKVKTEDGFACPTVNTNPGTDNENAATPQETTTTSSPGGGGGSGGEKIKKEDRVVGCGGANTSC